MNNGRLLEVAQRLSFQGSNSTALNDVFRRVTRFVLNVMAALNALATLLRVLITVNVPIFPRFAQAPNNGIIRSEVALSFGTPSNDVNRVSVRAIRLVLQRRVGLLLRRKGERRVAKGVRRRTAPLMNEYVRSITTYSTLLNDGLLRNLPNARRALTTNNASFGNVDYRVRLMYFQQENINGLNRLRRPLNDVIRLNVPYLNVSILNVDTCLIFCFRAITNIGRTLTRHGLLQF